MSEKWGPWKTLPEEPALGQIVELAGALVDPFGFDVRNYSKVGMVIAVGLDHVELDGEDPYPDFLKLIDKWRARLPPEYEADAKRGVEAEA